MVVYCILVESNFLANTLRPGNLQSTELNQLNQLMTKYYWCTQNVIWFWMLIKYSNIANTKWELSLLSSFSYCSFHFVTAKIDGALNFIASFLYCFFQRFLTYFLYCPLYSFCFSNYCKIHGCCSFLLLKVIGKLLQITFYIFLWAKKIEITIAIQILEEQ